MLVSLSIRGIVLIEAIDLEFRTGLNVLTGETGAGKSILMDALGFALGQRVRRDLVRNGESQGTVTAVFEIAAAHPLLGFLDAHELPGTDGEIILRRVASADGPSRAFINDQRISADVLARIGEHLVEVHGQHDDRGLLNPRGHRALLDTFGGHGAALGKTRVAWSALSTARAELAEARAALERAAADADYLRHSVDELSSLAPEPGEDAALETERRLIRNAGAFVEELGRAATDLSRTGAEGGLLDAFSRLSQIAEKAEGKLEPAIAALDRTMTELGEAQSALAGVLDELTFDPGRLELVEERLFAIRGLARKHNCQPEDLAAFAADMTKRLAAFDAGEDRIAGLEEIAQQAEVVYAKTAEVLSIARRKAGAELDRVVTEELPDLKMEAARFVTEIGVADAGADGVDAVRFTAAINPGTPPGAIDRIASGGELSRFLLALKVQLAQRSDGLTMIFDEIDRGVGGATADAVGRRLARVADAGQVLVVTHSPQVAAQADHHFRISKSTCDGIAATDVSALEAAERQDEIARMLAGGRVTDEARSAARALIDDARGGGGAGAKPVRA